MKCLRLLILLVLAFCPAFVMAEGNPYFLESVGGTDLEILSGPTRTFVPDFYLDDYLDRRGWNLADLRSGKIQHGGRRLAQETVEQALVRLDRALWIERAFLLDGKPYTLWRGPEGAAFQHSAARYQGDAVFLCGSENGKTDLICRMAFWYVLAWDQEVLVTSARGAQLKILFRTMLAMAKSSPVIRPLIDFKTSTVGGDSGYPIIFSRAGTAVNFRPEGQRGENSRSVHARAVLCDEVGSVSARETLDNWRSRGLPGSETRFFSAPTLDDKAPFVELAQRPTNVPASEYFEQHPEVLDPFSVPPPSGAENLAARDAIFAARPMVLFNWPQTWKPAPYWTEARNQRLLEHYGGAASPGYQVHVLGQIVTGSRSYFAEDAVRGALRTLEDFRWVQIDRHPTRSHVVRVSCLAGDYEEGSVADVYQAAPGASGGRPWASRQVAVQDEVSKELWAEIFRDILPPAIRNELKIRGSAGADIGWSADPTEIVVFVEREAPEGFFRELVLRITLDGFDLADLQAQIFHALVVELGIPKGFGIDATGRGRELENALDRLPPKIAKRFQPFDLSSDVPERDLDQPSRVLYQTDLEGKPIYIGGKKKPRMVPPGVLGLRFLTRDFEHGSIILPSDPELRGEIEGTRTVERGGRERVVDRPKDHVMQALQVWTLARIFQKTERMKVEPSVRIARPRA